MNRSIHVAGLATGIALIVLGSACGTYKVPPSPYSSLYGAGSVSMPSREEIRAVGVSRTVPLSKDELWDRLLRMSEHYEAVLDIETDPDGTRRMLLLTGFGTPIVVPWGKLHAGMSYQKTLDSWLAIAVTPSEVDSESRISTAWYSPSAKGAVPLPPLPESDGTPGGDTGDPDGLSELDTSASILRERARVLDLMSKMEPADRWELAPRANMGAFHYHLDMQIVAPSRWESKFPVASAQIGSNLPPVSTGKDRSSKSWTKHAELEDDTGDWASLGMRRAWPALHAPEVQARIEAIIQRLSSAAGQPYEDIEVYIVAAPSINAFALPNGDVFVTSGLLDTVETTDQLAAVLSHELVHLFRHDTLERLKSIRRGEITKDTIVAIAAIGVIVATAGMAVAAAPAAGAAQGAAAAAPSVGAQLSAQAAQLTVQAAANEMGDAVGSAVVFGFNEEAELYADAQGARIVAAAGFDPEAEMSLLSNLLQLQVQATERNEVITSGFINCDPGLEQRIVEMEKVLAGLPQR